MSAYSGRSIPRPRIYPMENQSMIGDDMRSHVSHFSGVVGKVPKARYVIIYSILDFHNIKQQKKLNLF